MAKIDLTTALEGKPRPHYLVGEAEYSFENGAHRLVATAVFPSSRDSIGDRAKAPVPHANVGDAYFAIWNAVHIISEMAGVCGTLTGEGQFRASRPIPPDTPLRLEVVLDNIRDSGRHVCSDYKGVYSLDNRKLLEISGKGVGRKIKEPSPVQSGTSEPDGFSCCYGFRES